MKRPVTVFLLAMVAAAFMIAGGCGDDPSGDAATPQAGVAAVGGADGAALYEKDCASCHGAAGEGGGGGPELSPLTSADQADIARAVREGVGSMAPYGDGMSPKDIAALAEYAAGLE